MNTPDKTTLSEIKYIAISFMALRQAIGVMGIAFPVVLFFGCLFMGYCEYWQSSISCYYHTVMRNVFEGVLCVYAVFLFFYRYERKDNIATTLAGICALGVAFCPVYVMDCTGCGDPAYTNELAGRFHLAFAASFFLILSYISLFLFTRTHPDKVPTKEKLQRNRVYVTCGIVMLVCMALIVVYFLWLEKSFPVLKNIRPVFCLETFSLWAFGFSWIIKGEMFLKDKM